MKTYKELLILLNACPAAIKWVGDKTVEQANKECITGAWMLWIAKMVGVDIKPFTLAKGYCVNTVRHLMQDKRSIAAVDAAIAFGKGEITEEELKTASYHAANAISIYPDSTDEYSADVADFADYTDYYTSAAAAAVYNAPIPNFSSADYSSTAYACSKSDNYFSARRENQMKTADICRKYIGKLIEEKVNKIINQ